MLLPAHKLAQLDFYHVDDFQKENYEAMTVFTLYWKKRLWWLSKSQTKLKFRCKTVTQNGQNYSVVLDEAIELKAQLLQWAKDSKIYHELNVLETVKNNKTNKPKFL